VRGGEEEGGRARDLKEVFTKRKQIRKSPNRKQLWEGMSQEEIQSSWDIEVTIRGGGWGGRDESNEQGEKSEMGT
jgi:hypothetical protein